MWRLYFKKSISSYIFLAITLASMFLFWRVASLSLDGSFSFFDSTFDHFLHHYQSAALVPTVVAITSFGDLYVLEFLAFLLFFFLLSRKAGIKILLVASTTLFTSSLSAFFKLVLFLPRPTDMLVFVGGFGFPSGHTAVATAFFITTLFVLLSEIKDVVSRFVITLFSFMMIAFVGASRLYLGVHWVSDVVGGFFLGLAVASFGIYIYKKIGMLAKFDFHRS